MWWRYDVLRALDYVRAVGEAPDPRLEEAIALVHSKRQAGGTWLLDRSHPGAVHIELDGVGMPSRWTTLRAMRVMAWYDDAKV